MSDFYTGFEGESEIRFVLKLCDAPERLVRLWEGYFDAIMARIEPEGGRWTGIALPYHLQGGWYEGAPWKLGVLEDVVAQWTRVDTNELDTRCQDAHAAVLALLIEAVECGGEVWISQE